MTTVIQASTFLDAYAYQLATPAQIATLANPLSTIAQQNAVLEAMTGFAPVAAGGADRVTVALTLDRANDPTALLSGSWASRAAALADETATFNTYGANAADFTATRTAINTLLGAGVHITAASVVSDAHTRTFWLELDAAQFQTLFGRDLLKIDAAGNFGWRGNLNLPDDIAAHLRGIWVDQQPTIKDRPNVTSGVDLPLGPLGVGNTSAEHTPTEVPALAVHYDFPLPNTIETNSIALVENTFEREADLRNALNAYRASLGFAPFSPTEFQVVRGATVGAVTGELALDVSILAAAAPNSSQLLYTGLSANRTAFIGYQQAFFDAVNNPGTLSSSLAIFGQSSPNSPFQRAWQDLLVDGALSRVSVHVAAGDSGSSAGQAFGEPLTRQSLSSAMALIVSGTSITTRSSAAQDETLDPAGSTAGLLDLALGNDRTTLYGLLHSGLKVLPSTLPTASTASVENPASVIPGLFETVWNAFSVRMVGGEKHVGLGSHDAATGGVDPAQAVPSYQADFGLNPTSTGPNPVSGRGTPDVSALAGGNAGYSVLNHRRVTDGTEPLLVSTGGTSAATPLWASLTAQIDAIFVDQGLPRLGFYNDLLYGAAAVRSGAFNDITLGNNTTTFFRSATPTGYVDPGSGHIVPTGFGYAAAPGYDLASGLGTPNGTLLARALSQIAHAQVSDDTPDLLTGMGTASGTSGVTQTVLLQSQLDAGAALITAGLNLTAAAPQSLAWTAAMAQKALEADMSAELIGLFDGQAQGSLASLSLSAGQVVSLQANGSTLNLFQQDYTSPNGFVQFGDAGAMVTMARPVAVAETAMGANDVEAVVRLRQMGMDATSLTIYRVDDLTGAIGGLRPGDAGYATAAASRAYEVVGGGTSIAGPGFGHYGSALIKGVDDGDFLAMVMTNVSKGTQLWGFSAANPRVDGVAPEQVWNYGLNTWGFEDGLGGADRDYNDLIVQLDFTSTAGSGWLL